MRKRFYALGIVFATALAGCLLAPAADASDHIWRGHYWNSDDCNTEGNRLISEGVATHFECTKHNPPWLLWDLYTWTDD